MSQDDINAFEQKETFTFMIDGQTVEIYRSDVEIISEDIPGWLVSNEGRLTVALDITVTEALKKEGLARELVNRIQNLRKSNGYDIVDKVRIAIVSIPEIVAVVEEYNQYIANQVLAVSIDLVEDIEEDATELDFDEFNLRIKVEKI